MCAPGNITVALSRGNGAAGTEYSDFILTNTGASSCTLKGFAVLQAVGGSDGHQLGRTAVHDTGFGDGSKTVTVKPDGKAYALLAFPSIYNYEQAGQDSSGQHVYEQKFTAACGSAVKSLGYRMYLPGSKLAIYIKQAAFPVCSNPQLTYLRVGAFDTQANSD